VSTKAVASCYWCYHNLAPCLPFQGFLASAPSPSGPSSEPGSLASSPSSSPLPQHRRHHPHHHHRPHDGYSSLERLNRRPRVNKTSLEKLFHWRASLDKEPAAKSGEAGSCSGEEEDEEEEGEEEEEGVAMDDGEFVRNHRERSTVLVRRFCRNNQKVIDQYPNRCIGFVVIILLVVFLSLVCLIHPS